MQSGEPDSSGTAGRDRSRGGPRLRGPWWFERPSELDAGERAELLDQLYFDGPDRAPFLRRFAVLLALSTLIATFGLAQDSIAVVIGAMLVSPLTTPLLGLSAGLVMGWPVRQLESLLILVIGTLGAIGLAWLTLKLLPEPTVITLSSSELLARTQPGLLDLGIALVSGGAGAYVLMRRQAIGALPGVAIAVALVPPLATVGMMLELGRSDLAGKALLLYLTNLVGIVLAGSLVMLVFGVRPTLKGDARVRRRIKIGLAGAALAAIAIAYPLGAETASRITEAVDEDDVTKAGEQWLAGTDLEIRDTRIDYDEDTVRFDVTGPQPPPSVDSLADDLAVHLGAEVKVTVGWTEEQLSTTIGSP